MLDAVKSYDNFPKTDTTILVRGIDGKILQRKGDTEFVGQNLAYLYNDFESLGQLQNKKYAD